MRFGSSALTWPAAILALAGVAQGLPRISRQGKYLYDPSGNRFFIKGVAYQPQGQLAQSSAANVDNGGFPEPSSYIDPLAATANCTRDIPYLRQLGVNAIRVYSVNASLDHDACMSALDSAGIYVMLDVSLPLNGSIDRSAPSWSTNLLNEYTTTINLFNKYSNVLAYNIANEVVTTTANTIAAPYVKAAARDIKAYLKGIGATAMVGYSATDGDAAFRNSMAHYMTCGSDDVSVDIYGLNNYEWCGSQNLDSSNWRTITAGFNDIPVATYMSEYGCITSPPRVWTEVAALYSSPVSDVFSGGVAFSYFPTSDGYGMVTFSGTNGATVNTSADFTRLAAQYNATSPPNTPTRSSAPAASTISCPTQNSTWLASSTLPPTPNEAVCNCVNQNAFACRVRPATANRPVILGSLLDYTCSLLGSSNSGASCSTIGGNGANGQYGVLSYCSPAIKLNYAFSAYYEFSPVPQSCDFSGNATLSANRPNTAQDAQSAAQSCLAQEPAGGVFTPRPASSSVASATSSGASSGGSGGAAASSSRAAGDRAVELVGRGGALWTAMGFTAVLAGGMAVLA